MIFRGCIIFLLHFRIGWCIRLTATLVVIRCRIRFEEILFCRSFPLREILSNFRDILHLFSSSIFRVRYWKEFIEFLLLTSIFRWRHFIGIMEFRKVPNTWSTWNICCSQCVLQVHNKGELNLVLQLKQLKIEYLLSIEYIDNTQSATFTRAVLKDDYCCTARHFVLTFI